MGYASDIIEYDSGIIKLFHGKLRMKQDANSME